ncbi:MAG: response regulator transcription factor [Pseudomonadota bacterium]|nr:MAG: response regulator transcription factor [Pseudomonadota bacterium]
MRLLVVEDDAELRGRLKQSLARAGFAVDAVDNGVEAGYLGTQEPYDAVVLDLGLPGRSGLEVLRQWRNDANTVPVVILTARDSWQEKVEGFKAGADDYLAKPFHMEELMARLNAVIRRRHAQPGGELRSGDLVLDEERQTVRRGTHNLELTATEFRLLRYFMLHPGRTLSKSVLTEHVYEYDADKDSNVIEAYVRRLRQKLGRDVIRTRRGQGYVFEGIR